MHLIKKNKGSALLTALFIMTLVAIVATAMSTRLQLDIYRTRLVINKDKLYLASQGVTFWAMDQLKTKSLKFNKANKQGLVALFPSNLGSQINEVKLSGGLYDLQSRFNLNNLIEKKSLLSFVNLATHITPKLSNTERVNLSLAIQGWLSAYELAFGEDKYTEYYLAQVPAYNASHQMMSSISELRLVKDVSAAIYLGIIPFVTVLPDKTAININTASMEVLQSLGGGINSAQAQEIIDARGTDGIKDLKDIDELIKKTNIPKEQISIDSKYFLSIAVASSDEFKLVVYSVLERKKDKDGNSTISVVKQTINNPGYG